ncbi:DUF305 domain-containing protein [Massilia sp. TWP1-3-3]|uniref:DUF305 domain-containing protein n=1 Tax=Massilia sp. TWP1-3-3 TaxID=2804573 RepID=UPI003CF7518E
MKLPQTCLKTALALACTAILAMPAVATAQASAPSAHLHAMPPAGGSTAVAPDLMAAMQKMHTEMEAMKMSGDMDHDFAMMMRGHHQGAIDMAKLELAHGKDKQIKQMAQKMIADQTKEIARLDKWMAQHMDMKK